MVLLREISCYTVCPHMWFSHKTHREQQVWECRGRFPCVVMSWYRWHQASFAICLLSPFPWLSSSSSSFKPICSTFAVITCLPSLWHIRGRRQAPFTPLSLLLLTPLSSHPYFCTHFTTEFSKGSRWHLALLSSWNQDGKQRSTTKRTKKPQKLGYTPFLILLGAYCASCAHRLGVDLLLLFMLPPPVDGCC